MLSSKFNFISVIEWIRLPAMFLVLTLILKVAAFITLQAVVLMCLS